MSAALARFGALLAGDETLALHVGQARAAIEQLRGMLEGAREIEWTALKRAVTPKLVTSGDVAEFTREGVTVWREGQEPWRPVKRLVVLGFAQGRYPASLSSNPVFAAEDLAAHPRHDRVAGDAAGRGAQAKTRAVPAAARCSQWTR